MSDLDNYLSEAGKRLQDATDSEVRSAKWLTTHAFNRLEDRLKGRADRYIVDSLKDAIATLEDNGITIRMVGNQMYFCNIETSNS